jgi:hypothetical protein
MGDPYRDADMLECPGCGSDLRVFNARLCCDACGGIMLPLVDLATAIEEHTHVAPQLAVIGSRPGARRCPRCRVDMAECRLDAQLGDRHPTLEPTLDHCATHGLWFDEFEIAAVLQVLRESTEPAQLARTLFAAWFRG